MTGSEVWLGVYDAIVNGAHHELNNRVASLSAVEQVVSGGGTLTEGLREALLSELRRMRWAIDLVGRIPAPGDRPNQAVLLQDVVATAAELIALHPIVRDTPVEVTCGDEIPPIRADPGALVRTVLVMITTAARVAGDGGVAVRCYGEHSRVTVTVGPAPSRGDLPQTAEAERLAITAWLRPSEGTVEPGSSAGTFTISLPALRRPDGT